MKKTHALAAGLAATLALTGGLALAREHGSKGDRMGGMSFETLDADGDGRITLEEMQARGTARFAETDTDGDGFLSQAELEAAAAARVADRVAKMLERMDADKDGKLSADEMQPRRGAGRGFDRMDADGDGGISKAEFDEAHARMREHRGDRHGDRHHGKGHHRMGHHGMDEDDS